MLFLLLLLPSTHGESRQIPVHEVVSRTEWNGHTAAVNVVDGNTTTFYHSGVDKNPEWLKLILPEETTVEKVVIINR